jgi:putative membrane protein
MPAMSYVIRLVISAVALWISTLLISGVHLTTDSTGKKILTLLVVAVIFGLVNMFIRPIIKALGCGLYVLTLGLIAIVVNGALFLLVSWISGEVHVPFHVDNFWPSAIFGALVVGVVSWLLGMAVPDRVSGDK